MVVHSRSQCKHSALPASDSACLSLTLCALQIYLLTNEKKNSNAHVAVAPGNAHFISVRQVSSDVATLRCDTCGYCHKPAAAAGWGCASDPAGRALPGLFS